MSDKLFGDDMLLLQLHNKDQCIAELEAALRDILPATIQQMDSDDIVYYRCNLCYVDNIEADEIIHEPDCPYMTAKGLLGDDATQ